MLERYTGETGDPGLGREVQGRCPGRDTIWPYFQGRLQLSSLIKGGWGRAGAFKTKGMSWWKARGTQYDGTVRSVGHL